MNPPTKTRFEQRMEAGTAAAGRGVAAGIGGWLGFTLGSDITPKAFGTIPHVALNWVTIAALTAAWWYVPAGTPRLVVAAITAAAVIYSIGRAARHLTARPKTISALFEVTRVSAKHPRGAATRPVNPDNHVAVTSWASPSQPQTGVIVYDPSSPAATQTGRGLLERDVDKVAGAPGKTVIYEWNPGRRQLPRGVQFGVAFEVVDDTDPRATRRGYRRAIDSALVALFPKPGADFTIDCDWADPQQVVPETVTVGYGSALFPDARLRAQVERGFDERVRLGVEWVYDWQVPGILLINAVDPDSGEAVRKRAHRKVLDGAVAILSAVGGRSSAGQVDAAVTDWFTDDTRSDTPSQVVASFGTTDFSDVSKRHQLVDALDQMLTSEWPDRAWIPTWQLGHAGQVTLNAVDTTHPDAIRKLETTKVRRIVVEGFPKTPGLDVDVSNWATGDDGSQKVAAMNVIYGTGNITDRTRQVAFEAHLDSQTVGNDWRYEWDAAPGVLRITAVPALPTRDLFPVEGSAEFNDWHGKFRKGVVWFGKARGGYDAEIKLNTSPHVLVGGSTGAGKSQLLGLILYGALMNPDVYELVIVDPKVTDFTWTGGYPNVLAYAPDDARKMYPQIRDAIGLAYTTMIERQSLLQRYGLRNLGLLRRAIQEGSITDMTLADVPKRLVLFFDEGSAAFNSPKGDDDGLEAQKQYRQWLEQICMLGRAMEVNVVMAAQKPTKDNIGTVIREQLVNKIGIGHLDLFTSQQVMGSNICDARLGVGAPKGRGWFVNDEGLELLFQCPYLPNDDEPCPWAPDISLRGIKEQVRDSLIATGWIEVNGQREMTRPKDPLNIESGETVTYQVPTSRWVRADRIDH